MFWRFGFHACSAIDTLLDKPDVTLEEILGEDDLLQECKAHNTKLIEYLRDPNILSKLLNYIIADEQIDDKAKFKYSYVSCEVLSCEIWSICETVVQSRELLTNFWTFLDRPSPLNPLQASYFTKVNEQFLEKKTDEMIPFIQSIPNIVPKLLRHIETSAIMDLLLKIISMEKSEPGSGIVEWLHDEGLIPALLMQMNPEVEPEIQGTVADVLKAVIAISANSSDAGVIGPNALSRELVSETTISRILDYMLDPDAPHSTASLTNGVSLIIELIRKNNSDYDIEPVLSLTLESHPPTSRDPIYLGTMLRVFASRIKDFQKLLAKPKSVPSSIATTFGHIEPLGFERFRICELYAELLHCSNMALLNDPRGEEVVRERDIERERLRKEGRSKPPAVDIWGDTALRTTDRQWRNETYSSDGSEEGDEKDKSAAEAVPSQTGQSDIHVEDAPSQQVITTSDVNHSEAESNVTAAENVEQEKSQTESKEINTGEGVVTDREMGNLPITTPNGEQNTDRNDLTGTLPSSTTNASSARPVVGDYLKMQFVESRVLPSVVDLFFAHPWNNFLHNVVYDILTQVLNGPMDKGFNRQLAIDLFTTGQLTEKILQGQKASDEAQAQDKGVRLGYMGHLTLIAEEVLKLAERIPLDLLDPAVVQKLSSHNWNEYVDVTLTATRTRDNAILGGVRPQPSVLTSGLHSSLGTNTAELSGVDEQAVLASIVDRGMRYENGDTVQGDDDFEPDTDREQTDEPFVRYMSQNLTNDLPDKFGSSDEDEDDEEVVGWMGEGGEFEPHGQDNDDGNEEDDDIREFGRRGLFHESWEGDFHDDDDEFGFRGLGRGLSIDEHDIHSSDEEDGDREVKPTEAELDRDLRLATAVAHMTTSTESLGLSAEDDETVNPWATHESLSKRDDQAENSQMSDSLGEDMGDIQNSNEPISRSIDESDEGEHKEQMLEVQEAKHETPPEDVD